jgi:lipoprotein-anchoring transpeptidase ErfK/SrfK
VLTFGARMYSGGLNRLTKLVHVTRLVRALSLKVVAAVVAGTVLLAAGGAFAWTTVLAGEAAHRYQQQRQALDAQLQAAAQQGYTSQELQPVTNQIHSLDASSTVPWWVPGRFAYLGYLTDQTAKLRALLTARERQILDQTRANAGQQLDSTKAQVAQDQQIGADPFDLTPLQQRLDAAAKAEASASTVRDYRNVIQQLQGIRSDAAGVYTQIQQENQQIAQSAQQLVSQMGGNLGAIQAAGNQAVANANNDATVAAYLNRSSPFKGYNVIQRASSRLGQFAGQIGAGDVNQAARGTAGVQRFANQIHGALIAGLPSQAVIVSFQAQHLWAYQNGQVIMDTPVTTGVRGVTDWGTDFGPMKVLWKSHPWTMHSPYPPGSPHWYPDTVVQWTTFFTNTGESIHDAYWEPDSMLGPGSQYNAATQSHGCIHVPAGRAQWMFNWAQIGTPVVVYPGDGAPVANQVAQITTNNHGQPLA